MYDSIDDPYCYPGTNVLKNRRDLRTQGVLDRFETAITAQRFSEPMPAGKLTEQHYKRVHRHIFRDVYAWAGQYREKVRISKGDSTSWSSARRGRCRRRRARRLKSCRAR